ncbi:MAG: YvcK family protein [Candidatus Tectomicrobia bacterium]|uniref:YvcK family protein n=1 Tax=Tectimicrobiota bacterium TaxID=2528274 RepID=A0A937W2G2_UNCTE|nr:YvcK family protein [Candidatus Tectomicrobia bacterium]
MHIVTLGNGTGQATLLHGLRAHACEVTAIVGVADNGGHSGQLRRLLHVPQVGDTRQCLSALLEPTSVWQHLLSHRFTEGELCGLSVGNMMLAALTQRYGSFLMAVESVRQAAGLHQRVLPVSDAETHIGAECQDGRCFIGEWDIIQRQPQSPITRLFLQPPVAAHPVVLEAIARADLLVICPGSLLTGTVALLLHGGMREAFAASQARCVYVGNLMTQPGQTDGYTARQHLSVLTTYLGRTVDVVVLNNGPLPADLLMFYTQYGAYPVLNDLTDTEVALSCADLVARPDEATWRTYTRPQGAGMDVGLHAMRHDAQRLAAHLVTLVPQEALAPENTFK